MQKSNRAKNVINLRPDCFAHMQRLLVMYLTKDLSLHFSTEKHVVTMRFGYWNYAFVIKYSGNRKIVQNYISNFHIILTALDSVLWDFSVYWCHLPCTCAVVPWSTWQLFLTVSTVLFSWKCADWFPLMSIYGLP